MAQPLDVPSCSRELRPVRLALLVIAGLSLVACGEAESGGLEATPIPNDLEILGLEMPNDPFSISCEFGAGRLHAPRWPHATRRVLSLRVPDTFPEARPGDPPDPASPHRSIPIRVERAAVDEVAGSRVLRLTRATARWNCSDDYFDYHRSIWEAEGIEPDWQMSPLELDGLERPFCGPNLEEVTEFELAVSPLELGPDEFGTAWVEILSPTDRRRFRSYLELLRLTQRCFRGAEWDRPLAEVNPPHCTNALAAIPSLFGVEAPPPPNPRGDLLRYTLRVGSGRFFVFPNVTLYFEDGEGFVYPVTAKLEIELAFSGILARNPSEYLCYERSVTEIGG